MRLVLIVLVAVAVLVPAAPASAVCTPLDPTENFEVPVRKPAGQQGYRAFILFDCVNGPTSGTVDSGKGSVTIVDATSVFTGSWLAEYRPAGDAPVVDGFTVNADSQAIHFDVANSPDSNSR